MTGIDIEPMGSDIMILWLVYIDDWDSKYCIIKYNMSHKFHLGPVDSNWIMKVKW
jgi:hypothetical protein